MRKATLYSRSTRPVPQAEPPAAPVDKPKKTPWLRAWLSRHRGPLAFVAGVAIAGLLVLLHATNATPQRSLTQQDIDAAAKAFAVNYRRVPTGDDYTISHTSFLYVMDANWRVRSMISTIGRTPDDVAACIRAGLGRDLR